MRRVDRTDILAAVDLMTAASVFALVLCCVIRLIAKKVRMLCGRENSHLKG